MNEVIVIIEKRDADSLASALSSETLKAELLDAAPSFMQQLMDAQPMTVDPDDPVIPMDYRGH